MSIRDVTLKYASTLGDATLQGRREYTKIFFVEVTSKDDGPMIVGNAPGIPHRGDWYTFGHEADRPALCRRVSPRPMTAYLWEVVCRFATAQKEPDDDKPPLDRRPKVRWSFTVEHDMLYADLDGTPYMNPVGDPMDPAPEEERYIQVASVTRNEASYNPTQARNYAGKVNEVAYAGWAQYVVRCATISASERQYDPDFELYYVPITYEFHFSPDRPWHPWNIVNMGYRALPDIDSEKQIWEDGNGVFSTAPIFLTEQGLETDHPTYTPFRKYKTVNFGPLGLEQYLQAGS